MNPLDDPDGRFLVVVNDEEQHALWPAFAPIPAGWSAVHGEDSRDGCAAYLERHWTDIRPRSLRDRIAAVRG